LGKIDESRLDKVKVAIQGELGSNSHMAALEMLGADAVEIVACAVSGDVFRAVLAGAVDGAVLPIENSLHGSVAEHYDLLLQHPVRVARESLFRVRHNVIVKPGVMLKDVKRVMSHPVALSQCRKWLAAHPEIEVVTFYDTAGSVKHVVNLGLTDAAGIAPRLAAEQYGAEVLVEGIEDHAENFTRFHLVVREGGNAETVGGVSKPTSGEPDMGHAPDKASVAFSVAHRPGTLVKALEEFARAGVNLTKIESRPVPGRPWEYVFFVELGFQTVGQIEQALAGLAQHCQMVKELGRYVAA
jgi:prephenate dehydratase